MAVEVTFLAIFSVFVVILSSFPLAIADLVYATKYYGADSLCNDATTGITPDNWLMVHGIVTICIVGALIVCIFCLICSDNIDFDIMIVVFIAYAISGLFDVAWNIIGAVMLWRDNLDCQPNDLKNYLYASVIIKLVFLMINMCRSLFKERVRD
ncbi:MAG: hypothetical protein Sylvanvirus25_11 [Sylvanvirus sp.]|uniref:Uncharacterized protein n=1 Tax=Sylvanvirus sp. TaxID=2487774 RepID=A0A3G5AM65_9VIRU|nr:MAG: hypothetical protein Sylvanvirus25_11 [Sylvanvirus sp.]